MPPDDNEEFNEAWRRVIAEFRASAAPDRLMFITLTFSNDFTPDELLDRIGETLKTLLTDPEFRQAMGWK